MWVLYCDKNDPAYLWTGLDIMRSTIDTQQGDLLGRSLFDLALLRMLLKLQ